VMACILVAVPSLFMNLTEVTDLCSIGTLFAFVLVSGGALVLDEQSKGRIATPDKKEFRIPYLNSRYFLPLIWIGIGILIWYIYPSLIRTSSQYPDIQSSSHPAIQYLASSIRHLSLHHIPVIIFALIAVIITFFSIRKQWSLIPVLGLLTNLYLMAQLGITNWMRFGIWLVIGLVIYFSFGIRKSRLKVTIQNTKNMNS
jgi:APA family basic amino acid/polyamine antiporter